MDGDAIAMNGDGQRPLSNDDVTLCMGEGTMIGTAFRQDRTAACVVWVAKAAFIKRFIRSQIYRLQYAGIILNRLTSSI